MPKIEEVLQELGVVCKAAVGVEAVVAAVRCNLKQLGALQKVKRHLRGWLRAVRIEERLGC